MARLREEKRAQMKRLLVETSFAMAVERGMDGFIIDDVTTAVGCSRRTFANYFSCKEEAVAEVAVLAANDGLGSLRFEPTAKTLLDSLEGAVRLQLNDSTALKLTQLIVLAQSHRALEPHILATGGKIMRLMLDAVAREWDDAPASLDTVLLVAACYALFGALTSGEITLDRPAGDSTGTGRLKSGDSAGSDREIGNPADVEPEGRAVSLERLAEVFFDKLRNGF
jgi:AcrR family transcriptional regulator